jgi:hypothetical protein
LVGYLGPVAWDDDERGLHGGALKPSELIDEAVRHILENNVGGLTHDQAVLAAVLAYLDAKHVSEYGVPAEENE